MNANFDKSKYKALLIDFDGTLVGKEATASANLVAAITKVRQKGFIVSVATGRMFYGQVKQVCQTLGLTAPQIVRAGSEIIDPKSEQTMWLQCIPDETARRVIMLLKEKKIKFIVDKGKYAYVFAESDLPVFDPEIERRPFSSLEITNIPKIIVLARYDATESLRLKEQLGEMFKDIHVVQFHFADRCGVDITSEKASKHLAALEYSKIIGINPHEMIGIGDSYNDYPLLTACGFKVAMGQSPQELKDIADYVAPAQAENGLLTFINKFLL